MHIINHLVRALVALTAALIIGIITVLVPALGAGTAALTISAWAWYRITTGNEARGGHIYTHSAASMHDRWNT